MSNFTIKRAMPFASRRRSFRTSLRDLDLGFWAAAVAAFAVIITLAVILYPTTSDAKSVARKNGFTSITHVQRSWFNFCHEGYVGYRVTGYRGAAPAKITVCANEFHFLSYTR